MTLARRLAIVWLVTVVPATGVMYAALYDQVALSTPGNSGSTILWCAAMIVVTVPGLALLLVGARRRVLAPLRDLGRAVTDGVNRSQLTKRMPPEFRGIVDTFAAREAAWTEELALRRLLVHEVNHRVANALQMVVSLLRLETAADGPSEPDRYSANLLRNAQDRVATVAAVHQSIRGIEADGTDDVGQLLWSIADRLVTAFGYADRMAVSVNVQPMPLTTDETVIIAILVNEWTTVSLSGCASDVDTGSISISLALDGRDRALRLERDFDVEYKAYEHRLSDELMYGLSRQLGGRQNSPGHTLRSLSIVFPKRPLQ